MFATGRRILVVEDDQSWCNLFTNLFLNPPVEYRTLYGDECFDVVLAKHKAAADEQLLRAVASFRPFDVVLLDLRIPLSEGRESNSEIENGVTLFNSLDERSCNHVVVASDYFDLKHLGQFRKALEAGRADFAKKEMSLEVVFLCVVNALRKGYLKLQAHWNKRLEKRDREWLLVQSNARIADCLSQIVTDGVGQLREHARQLADQLASRYEIRADRDRDDPISRTVRDIVADANRISSQFLEVRNGLGDPTSTQTPPRDERLEDLVRERTELCRAGLALKRLHLAPLPDGEHVVRIFRQDIEMILDELLCNAIEASNTDGTVSVRIEGTTGAHGERAIEILVTDQAPGIAEADRDKIASSAPLTPRNGRCWGLSLAQRMAEASGSSIGIETDSAGLGNTVALRIPVAIW